MKKIFVAAAMVAFAFTACNNASQNSTTEENIAEVVTEVVSGAVESSIVGVYEGELPAADGGAFATKLELLADGTFSLEQTPTMGEDKSTEVLKGNYTIEGNKIEFSIETLSSAIIEGETITYLDASGDLAPLYKLTRVAQAGE